jgi:hypothetical protein
MMMPHFYWIFSSLQILSSSPFCACALLPCGKRKPVKTSYHLRLGQSIWERTSARTFPGMATLTKVQPRLLSALSLYIVTEIVD